MQPVVSVHQERESIEMLAIMPQAGIKAQYRGSFRSRSGSHRMRTMYSVAGFVKSASAGSLAGA